MTGSHGRDRRRTSTVAGGVVLLAAFLTGCGGDEAELSEPSPQVAEVAESATASATPAAGALREQERPRVPDLPPGDPGLDAPAAPDPGTSGLHDGHGRAGDGHGARDSVPAEALLSAETVGTALGGRWHRVPGAPDGCMVLESFVTQRSQTYASRSSGETLEQTVAVYADGSAADAAVEAMAGTADACGWASSPDPRLGTASVAAVDPSSQRGRTMTAVAAEEGVVVLLTASGPSGADPGRWPWLVDLAMGSSCPAAPDGCH